MMNPSVKIVVFQNYPCEDAATVGEAFERLGHELMVVDCYNGAREPSVDDAEAMLVLGGPMNVYEERTYPFLHWETLCIREWAMMGRPFLGLCLGAQLLCKALGGRVNRNPEREIGHYTVDLTEEGRTDELFRGLPEPLPVIQWHQDTFSIPEGATWLARSEKCAHQAFRFRRAVGLQFHLEIGRAKMENWIREYVGDLATSNLDVSGLLRDFDEREQLYREYCYRLVSNFCVSASQARYTP